jgi:NADH-quinone oxidoreductase subunit N
MPRTWTVGLQVVVPKVVAVLVIARVVASVLPAWGGRVDVAVALFAGMALAVGTATAVAATDVRGLLASAAQAHAGVWLAGLTVACWETAHPQHSLTVASGLPGGVSAAVFCLCADGLALLGVFATLAYLARPDRPVTFAEDLTGLIRQERLAAGVLCVCLLSLTGVPPLPGFWGRLWVLMAAFSPRHASTLTGLYEPHFGFLLLAAVVALSMAAIAIAYVRLLATIVLDEPLGRQQPGGGRAALAAGAIIALVVTAVGLAPGILLREVQIDNGPAARIVPSPPRRVPDVEPEPEATSPGGGGQQGRAAVESGSFRPTAPNA